MSSATALLVPHPPRCCIRIYAVPICGSRLSIHLPPNPPLIGAPLLRWHGLGCLRATVHAPSSFKYPPKAFTPDADAGFNDDIGFNDDVGFKGKMVDQFSFDGFLSFAEVFCIAPPIIYAIGSFIGSLLPSGAPKVFRVSSGNPVFACQLLLLAGAVVVGALIRQRQWQRISQDTNGVSGCDLIQRIEKLEEDLRSTAGIVRALARQLEKLGIRFRVTKKAMKEPIAETAALAQKNSEATRALVLQEAVLEKELVEIQKVLLAMQEQQQKQLDLILIMGKAGKLFESRQQVPATDGTGKVKVAPENKMSQKTEIQLGNNDNV